MLKKNKQIENKDFKRVLVFYNLYIKNSVTKYMKSLVEIINEGLFSRNKKYNPLNLPGKMPKKYVDFFEKYFSDVQDDIKDEADVEEYLEYSCDEFWDMVSNEYWNPRKFDLDIFRKNVYGMWIDQIIEIALK